MKRRAVFIDRDGVINEKMSEGDYVKEWSEFRLLPGAWKALTQLKEKGFLNIIVTNQRCVARGIISEAKLKDIHEKMTAALNVKGAVIDAVYYCVHDIGDGCSCRKPKPGMIFKAVSDFRARGVRIDLPESYLVGDDERDILAGKAAGLRTIKVAGELFMAHHNSIDLLAASDLICSRGVSL